LPQVGVRLHMAGRLADAESLYAHPAAEPGRRLLLTQSDRLGAAGARVELEVDHHLVRQRFELALQVRIG